MILKLELKVQGLGRNGRQRLPTVGGEGLGVFRIRVQGLGIQCQGLEVKLHGVGRNCGKRLLDDERVGRVEVGQREMHVPTLGLRV